MSIFRRDKEAVPGLRANDRLKILVIRPDRIGDVILSTPVMEAIQQHFVRSHITVLVQDYVTPLLKGLSFVDHLMVFDPKGKHAGIRGFFKLWAEIRHGKFTIAVVLQTHWKIVLAVFLSGIRYRVGPFSKIYSYLFFNRGIRQRRSHVEMHETDYNLQLLRKLGIRVGTRKIATQVHVSQDVRTQATDWLKKQGWNSTQPLIIIHPGMGGSALNWPETHYEELLKALVHENRQVLVTGGAGEKDLIDRLKRVLGELAGKVIFYIAEPQQTIEYLGGLFSCANVVVAPSTGPLHLAVALGKRVVTFYSPIRVQSAIRWGPYLADESRTSILVPEVYCGQDFKCLGTLCNYFLCMKSLTVKHALLETRRHVEQDWAEQK